MARASRLLKKVSSTDPLYLLHRHRFVVLSILVGMLLWSLKAWLHYPFEKETKEAWVSNKELTIGSLITSSDFTLVRVPKNLVVIESIGAHSGDRLITSLPAGTLLTTALIEPKPHLPPGFAKQSVQIANPSILSILQSGSQVTLVTSDDSGKKQTITKTALVLPETFHTQLQKVGPFSDQKSNILVLALDQEAVLHLAKLAFWQEIQVLLM